MESHVWATWQRFRAWLTQLMSWARSDFTTAEARAIELIALDPASHPYHAVGSIDPEFEAVLHYALLQDLGLCQLN